MLRTTQWTRASFSSSRHVSDVFDEEKTMFVTDLIRGVRDKPLVKPAAGSALCGECGGCDSYSCMWSSLKEQTVDALATGAEEGRSNLR